MALVDYSSSEGEEDEDDQPRRQEPVAKRRKQVQTNTSAATATAKDTPQSEMPPLPSAFHDLYASTVRQSVVDDPSLHQGRKRQNPHVPGHWPSHLYVEWHPTKAQHDELVQLLSDVQAETDDQIELHQFLTSDLGAPLPLHISLSRPINLPGADKDAFLDDVSSAIRSSGVHAFTVSPRELAWFKSPDSNRSFLILRVETTSGDKGQNPELMTLLTRCNAVATRFGQPVLYQQNGNENVSTGNAFHVSVGWALGLSDEQRAMMGLQALEQGKAREMRTWELGVEGIKAKIGNVVSHIPLMEVGRNGPGKREKPDNLF